MAGSYSACIAGGSTIQTQTGNEAGPVAQGLNTRFGEYNGPMNGSQATYPPDVIVDAQSPALQRRTAQCERSDARATTSTRAARTSQHENIDQLYNYQDYNADLANPASYDYQPTSGRRHRRVRATRGGGAGRQLQRHGERTGFGVRCSASRASSCCSRPSSRATTRSCTASSSGLRGERYAGAEPGRRQWSAHHPALPRSCEQRLMNDAHVHAHAQQCRAASRRSSSRSARRCCCCCCSRRPRSGASAIQYNTLTKAVRDGAALRRQRTRRSAPRES